MVIRELECPACDIQVRGHFPRESRFQSLSPQQWDFLESFLRNRGVIRDIEADMGISYPTVRSRLDGLLAALGYGNPGDKAAEASAVTSNTRRIDILNALDRGEIDAATAVQLMQSAG